MNLYKYKKNWCKNWAEKNCQDKDSFNAAFTAILEFEARNLEKHYDEVIEFFFSQQNLVKDIDEFENCLTDESFFENLKDFEEIQLQYCHKKYQEARRCSYEENYYDEFDFLEEEEYD